MFFFIGRCSLSLRFHPSLILSSQCCVISALSLLGHHSHTLVVSRLPKLL